MRALILAAAATLFLIAVAGATEREQKPGQAEVDTLLSRVAERVQQYFARAQSIVCQEVVTIQNMDRDMNSHSYAARHLVYDLRVAWGASDGTPEAATIQRELLKVDGHAPKAKDEPRCMDPENISPEPLAFLLPDKQADYLFTPGEVRRVDGRRFVTIEARVRAPGKTEVTQKMDECWSFDAPSRTKYRVWVDAETGDVRRLDQSIGRVEFRLPLDRKKPDAPTWAIIERFEWSIRYNPVQFHEPEDTVLLPASIESLQLDQVGVSKAVRVTHAYSKYRRFMTGGRLVKD